MNLKLDTNKIYILFGVGLGYMAANIVKNNPDASLIIYEPMSALADRFCSSYSDIIHKQNVSFLTEIEYEPIYNFIAEQADYGSKRLEFITTPYCDIMKDAAQQILEYIKKVYEIYVQNLFTRIPLFFVPLHPEKSFIIKKEKKYGNPICRSVENQDG